MESGRVWCLKYGPDSKPPVEMQDVRAKADQDVPQLVKTATSGKWHFTTPMRLPALQMDFHQATGVRISNQTVRNRLHEDDFYSR